MDMVYYFNDTHAGDCLLVSLILTIEGFIQYLSSTNVALEDNVLTEQEHSPSEDRNTNDNGINEFDDTEDIEVDTNNKDQGSLLAEAKDRFYKLYEARFHKMSNSTLITREKYDKIVEILLRNNTITKGKKLSKKERDSIKKYVLVGNVGGKCLYRKGSFNNHLSITTYEDVFDVMQSTHESLGHPRDYRKNKYALDELYYKIPEQCVKLFLKLCPLCFPAKKRKAKHQIPLKMIYSPEFGHRAQIDLIDMTTKSVHGYNYILRYVDHLSGFAHVACTRTKKAEEIGIKLVHILSTAVTPEILQSDNGNEFLGKCIRIIKTFYGYLHIVKGRTYHPQSQGKIERGHSTFKEALQKWMESNGRCEP